MMKFFVILYVVYKDETPDKKSIYMAETEDDAIKLFYKYMGEYIAVDNVYSVNVEAKNSVGGIFKNESWVSKTQEPEE